MPTQACWVCRSQETEITKARSLARKLVSEDLLITDSRYGLTLELWRCRSCGFVFANGEEVSEVAGLYEQLSDPGYEQGVESRTLQMRWLLRLGRERRPDARTLLEVGAGVGLLIREAQRMGLDAVGVEPSLALVDAARRLCSVSLLQGFFPHPALQGRTVDLIYLVDVIEHVSEPVKLLRDCRNMLSPEGLMLVVTPDLSSIAARLMGNRWWHFRLAHIGYFDGKSFPMAAGEAGLRVVGTERARWFFPLDYLAERAAVYLGQKIQLWGREHGPRRWLPRWTVRVNLRDSTVFFLEKD